jgi:hypothetical protein
MIISSVRIGGAICSKFYTINGNGAVLFLDLKYEEIYAKLSFCISVELALNPRIILLKLR